MLRHIHGIKLLGVCSLFAIPVQAAASSTTVEFERDPDFAIGLDESQPLGFAASLCVRDDGHVFLLDLGFRQLNEYDADGRFVRTLMGEGEGPGELQNATAMTLAPDGRFFVVGRSSRVSVIDPQGSEPQTLRADYVHSPRGICLLPDGDYVVSGLDASNHQMLHRYDRATQERTNSFCDSFAEDQQIHPRQEAVEAGGLLVRQGQQLLYLQIHPPELRVFDLDGKLLAQHDVAGADTIPTRPMEQNEDSVRFFTPQIGSMSLIPLSRDRVLIAYYRRPELDDPDSAETVLLEFSLGRARVVARSKRSGVFAPQCLDGAGWFYVSEVEEDVPVIRRYRLVR